MIRLFLIVTTLFMFNTASATSLHPCTPIVELAPILISCNDKDVNYFIEIKTVASPNISICQGPNRYLYQTADVSVSNNDNGTILKQYTLQQNQFSFKLGTLSSEFTFKDLGTTLKDCVTPSHGGVSIGN